METRKYYHICLKSAEVMFRVTEDYVQGINRLLLSAKRNETEVVSYSLMSNHLHFIVYCYCPLLTISSFSNSYTKWFNNKYLRSGSLMRRSGKPILLFDYNYIVATINYIHRNPVHHNIVEYPNGYPFSSSRYYFSKSMGVSQIKDYSMVWKERKRHVSKRDLLRFPGITVNSIGLMPVEKSLSIKRGESFFKTVRNYAYHLNKPLQEELAEFKTKHIEDIYEKMELENRTIRVNDIEVCDFIEKYLTKNKLHPSYTQLSQTERLKLSQILMKELWCNELQVARCLGG